MAKRYRFGVARRATNILMGALLRVGIPAPQRTSWLLTTTGRRSGRLRTVPVNLVVDGDVRYLVSPYGEVGWVHNLRAHPVAVLRRGRRRHELAASELAATEAGPILRRYAKQVLITRPYFDARPADDVTAFAAEAARHPVFRLGS